MSFHSDLYYDIHELLGVPVGSAKKAGEKRLGPTILRTICKTITDALRRGEDVYIAGFGTFRVVQWKARTTKNSMISNYPFITSPHPITHRSRKRVIFIPSEALRAMINIDTPNAHNRRTREAW